MKFFKIMRAIGAVLAVTAMACAWHEMGLRAFGFVGSAVAGMLGVVLCDKEIYRDMYFEYDDDEEEQDDDGSGEA